MDTFTIRDAALSYNYGGERLDWGSRDQYAHYKLLRDVLSFLGGTGFHVPGDKRINKDYPMLSKDHWQGRYGDLEFKAERYPAGFKIEFYQNVNFVNACGGYYDIDKYKKMPYLIRLQFDLTAKKLSKFLTDRGVENKTELTPATSEDFVIADYVRGWHHKESDGFTLESTHGRSPDQSYNCQDREKKVLRNGQIKWFRHYNGYLYRGTVYHNINNMWWVITDKYNVSNVTSSNLFDLSESDQRGRLKKHRPPEEYVKRKEQLSKATIGELRNEIKRRIEPCKN